MEQSLFTFSGQNGKLEVPPPMKAIHQRPKRVSIHDYVSEKCWEGIIHQPVLISGYIAFSYKLQQFFFQLQEGTYREAAAIIGFSSEWLLLPFYHAAFR